MDLLFKAVASDLSWCAEQGFPISANQFGPMDLLRKTATETQGNYYLILICLSTERGRRIMAGSSLDEEGICLDDVIFTMLLALAYDEWTKDRELRRWEVDNAEDAVAHLMQCMIDYLPIELTEKVKGSKEPGSNGYHKVKFHALWLILMYIRKSKISSDAPLASPGLSQGGVMRTNECTMRCAAFSYGIM